MTIESIIRILALLALAALYVSDFGFALWARQPGTEVYLALLAVALGVDVNWARSVLKAVITKTLSVGPVDEGKGE